jgi:hypothetical protein
MDSILKKRKPISPLRKKIFAGLVIYIFIHYILVYEQGKNLDVTTAIILSFDLHEQCNYVPRSKEELIKFLDKNSPCVQKWEKQPYTSRRFLKRELEKVSVEAIDESNVKFCSEVSGFCKTVNYNESLSWALNVWNK